jgi:hypothetical protein
MSNHLHTDEAPSREEPRHDLLKPHNLVIHLKAVVRYHVSVSKEAHDLAFVDMVDPIYHHLAL